MGGKREMDMGSMQTKTPFSRLGPGCTASFGNEGERSRG